MSLGLEFLNHLKSKIEIKVNIQKNTTRIENQVINIRTNVA